MTSDSAVTGLYTSGTVMTGDSTVTGVCTLMGQ